jgi:3-hydroxypropanoate dehydrogenase
MTAVSYEVLDTLFLSARTQNGFLPQTAFDDALLRRIYDTAKMGPTAANTQPLRVTYLRSAEAKARLKPALSAGNLEKTMAAPATAILAYDLAFPDYLPRLFPHAPDAPNWFRDEAARKAAAELNCGIQIGFFILAARALGVDCGPMGGFDRSKVDAEFFNGTEVRSYVLCNLGHGDSSKLFPRSPRLAFDEACKVL